MNDEQQIVAIIIGIIVIVILIKLWRVILGLGVVAFIAVAFLCAQDEIDCPLNGGTAIDEEIVPSVGSTTGADRSQNSDANNGRNYQSHSDDRPRSPPRTPSRSWLEIENCKSRCRSDYDMRTQSSERARCARKCEQR